MDTVNFKENIRMCTNSIVHYLLKRYQDFQWKKVLTCSDKFVFETKIGKYFVTVKGELPRILVLAEGDTEPHIMQDNEKGNIKELYDAVENYCNYYDDMMWLTSFYDCLTGGE